MFADDYLGIVDARRFTDNLDRFLDEGGEGLLSLALATDDAEAVRRGFYRASIGTTRRRRWGVCWNCPRARSMRTSPGSPAAGGDAAAQGLRLPTPDAGSGVPIAWRAMKQGSRRASEALSSASGRRALVWLRFR
jgi:hypothetical protein